MAGLNYMGFDFVKWFRMKNEGDVILSYKGEITTDLITDILDVIESKLNSENANPKLIKKLYNVLVECLQNLYHHAEKIPVNGQGNIKQADMNVFVVTRNGQGFDITTGNIVKNENILKLTKKMDYINSLNEEELKSHYKEVLNNQDFSEKGGGGLGMIDMVRKSGSKLYYQFHEFQKDLSYFDFNIKIS